MKLQVLPPARLSPPLIVRSRVRAFLTSSFTKLLRGQGVTCRAVVGMFYLTLGSSLQLPSLTKIMDEEEDAAP